MTHSPADSQLPGIDEPDLDLSIIAPAHNEQDNIDGLIADVRDAFGQADLTFELIVVDDGSTDATAQRLIAQLAQHDWLRAVTMLDTPPDRGHGQSAAFCAGIGAARGELIALMDADRQNDPADLLRMIERLRTEQADMVQGDRSGDRRDTMVRRVSSWVGRTFRRCLLGDTIRDTGCSLRVMKRAIALQLPLQYAGMHRFIPVYARMLGATVIEMPVAHRPRVAGRAKYGVANRALVGLRDLFAARWMRRRLRPTRCKPMEPDGS